MIVVKLITSDFVGTHMTIESSVFFFFQHEVSFLFHVLLQEFSRYH